MCTNSIDLNHLKQSKLIHHISIMDRYILRKIHHIIYIVHVIFTNKGFTCFQKEIDQTYFRVNTATPFQKDFVMTHVAKGQKPLAGPFLILFTHLGSSTGYDHFLQSPRGNDNDEVERKASHRSGHIIMLSPFSSYYRMGQESVTVKRLL